MGKLGGSGFDTSAENYNEMASKLGTSLPPCWCTEDSGVSPQMTRHGYVCGG